MNITIKTSSGEYSAKIRSYGLTGAICCVYEVKAFNVLGFEFQLKKKVWEGKDIREMFQVEREKPAWLHSWVKQSVAEYEDYRKAWDDWSEKK